MAASELAAVIGTVTVVVGGAAIVVPMSLKASVDPPNDLQADVIPSDPSISSPLIAVRDFVRAGGAIVNASGTSVLFWYRDEDDRGIMNEDELVLLSYQSTVGAFTVSRFEITEGASPRVQPDTVMGQDFAARWTYNSDLTTDVLSGGFDAVRIETSRVRPGAVTLDFRFNWANREADAEYGEFGFRVSLPAVRGDGA